MKKYLYLKLSFLVLLPSLLYGQSGIVNNGAKIKVMATANVKMNGGGMTSKNGGEISNAGNMYLDLDWTQTGATTTYSGAGWMWFEGAGNQNISSVSPITVPKLRVDNGNTLLLGSTVMVSTQVDFMSNGNIQLGTNNLIMLPTSTMVGYNTTNRVITDNTGFLQREVSAGAVFFPVGNSAYNPLTLTNTGTTDNFQLRVEDQVWDRGTTGNVETTDIVGRTWHLDEQVAGGSMANITVQWATGEELAGFDRSNCAVSHWDGSFWDHSMAYTASGAVAAGIWNQTRIGQTTFSPFAVEDLSLELPIELLFFEAERKDIDEVKLYWSTASEINNQGFEVERMLDNEENFAYIGFVEGLGNSTEQVSYSLIDDNAYEGTSYYRLRQIDFDGSYTYSDIRAVDGIATNNSSVNIYPNPTSNELNIRFGPLPKLAKSADIRIWEVSGRLIYEATSAVAQQQIITIPEVQNFPSAMYLLGITLDSGEHFNKKFIRK